MTNHPATDDGLGCFFILAGIALIILALKYQF